MNKSDIIIPTFNRPNYLNRILSYYDNCKIKSTCIIADSSNNENKKKNREIISKFSDINIIYLKPYSSDFNMFYKIADALNFTKEKYCVICADDDFIIPSGINMAVDFLDKNPDYAIAHGDYISFYKHQENNKKHFLWDLAPYYKSITSSDPKERFLYHLSNYSRLHPTFYAVHRTDFLKMIFNETVKYTDPENDGQFGELLPSMLTSIHGKIKQFKVLYCARESIPLSAGRTSKKFHDFVSEGTYDKKYSRFKKCLAEHLSKESDINIKEARKTVDKGWSEYTKKYNGFLIPKLNFFINKIPFPTEFEQVSRKMLRNVFKKNNSIKQTDRFSKDRPSKYLDDFKSIKKFVLDHEN